MASSNQLSVLPERSGPDLSGTGEGGAVSLWRSPRAEPEANRHGPSFSFTDSVTADRRDVTHEIDLLSGQFPDIRLDDNKPAILDAQ